ncbi:MAG: GH36 C-terminal domain-containing protein, partial [Clostridia bacterium]|nr:GH36 C-terminal domain-containing protein [Clostridia bacterium]
SKDKTEAILVTYRRMASVNNQIKRVRMAGLDPEKRYEVAELGQTVSGAALMQIGLVPNWSGDFAAVEYHFKAID